MAANSSIDLTSLDFDGIKSNFKTFLKTQSVFKDFDFEGSNINVLLDVLSYNTFLNSFYLNMVASESFLDSAQLRDSIISHAKELNYLPRSNKSSRITLEPFWIKTNKEVKTLIMPKGTLFSSYVRGNSYNFVTDSVYINNTPVYDPNEDVNKFMISKRVIPTDGTPSYVEDPFVVYQGNYSSDTFVIDYSMESQRFILTDNMVDTDSITVSVTEDSGAARYDYTYSSTLLGVKNSDPVYFLQIAEGGKYELVFGDNIIGRRPKNGAVITVQYRVTSGADGNGATIFTLDTNVASSSGGILVDITSPITSSKNLPAGSYGGDNAESIEQIRYKAPRYFQTQERAVTTSDYEILLRNQFPEIQSIAVFGGETFDPPLYGKVYISVKLKDVDQLPDAKKVEYAAFIDPRSPMAIDSVFISPEYLYYKLDASVNYNINISKARPDQIKSSVVNTIKDYNAKNFDNFNVTLRRSRLINAIDTADPSIISNETQLYVYKKIVPLLGVSQNITIRFGLPLDETLPELGIVHSASDVLSIFSTSFTYNGETMWLEDDGFNDPIDGRGNIRLVTKTKNEHYFVKNIGKVDYFNGVVTISDFNISAFAGNELRVYAVPKYDDISVIGNNIFTIGLDELSVTVNTVRV